MSIYDRFDKEESTIGLFFAVWAALLGSVIVILVGGAILLGLGALLFKAFGEMAAAFYFFIIGLGLLAALITAWAKGD